MSHTQKKVNDQSITTNLIQYQVFLCVLLEEPIFTVLTLGIPFGLVSKQFITLHLKHIHFGNQIFKRNC